MIQVRTEPVPCGICGCADIARVVCVTKDFCYETCDNEFQYVECAACGHVYLKNRPVLQELARIYPNNYLAYNYESTLGGFINRLRNYVQRAKIAPIRRYARANDMIVDVGSGAGDFLMQVRAFGDPTWTLAGVDFSAAALEGLRARGLTGISERFETCDWPLAAPGVIVMNQLIEHVENPRASLQKAFDILRPGGHLIIETPNLKSWDAALFRRRHWGGWHAPRHWNLFTSESLSQLSHDAGFRIEEISYTLNPFGWLHSIQYLLRDRFKLHRLGRMFDVDRIVMLCWASGLDVVQRLLTGRTSNVRMVLVKPERNGASHTPRP